MSGANQDGAPFAKTTRDHVTDKRTFRFHSDVPPPRGDTVFTVRTDSGSLQAHAQKSQRIETIAKLDGGDFDTHRFWNWKADIVSRLGVNHDLYNTELSRMALIWGCTHENGLARAILSPRYNHPNTAIKFQHWEEMMDALNERLLTGAEVAIERRKFKRAAKDVVKGKGRRGRKRKSVLPDEGKPDPEPNPELVLEPEPESEPELETGLEPEPEMARIAKKARKSTGKRARKRTSIVNAHQLEPALDPEPVSQLATCSAPVAQMY